MEDLIYRDSVVTWLENIGYPELAQAIADPERFQTHIPYTIAYMDENTRQLRIDVNDFHIAIANESILSTDPDESARMATEVAADEFKNFIYSLIRNWRIDYYERLYKQRKSNQ